MAQMVQMSIFMDLLPLKLCGKEGLTCAVAAGIPHKTICHGALLHNESKKKKKKKKNQDKRKKEKKWDKVIEAILWS